jgi:O-antigen/teichoic acid export membrane protein
MVHARRTIGDAGDSDEHSGDPSGVVGRIYGNLGKLLGGKAAAGVISLIYMVLALRALGPRDYGVLILVHTFAMTVGGIIEFPGWHAVVRYGAQAIEAGDQPRLLRLMRFTALVETGGGIAAIATAALLAPLIGPRLGWTPTAIAFSLPYSLAVLATIRSTPSGYLQLTGRFDLLGAHNLIAPVVRLLGAGIAVLLGAGLRGFLIAWLAAAICEWAGMWALGLYVARRRLGGARLVGSPRGAMAENEGIRRFMIAANADVTFGDLAPRIAPLVVGWFLGPASAGVYAVAQRATAVIVQPAGILGQAAYAELARLVSAGVHGSVVRHALVRSVRLALIPAVPLLAFVTLFGREVARWLGGSGFEQAGNLMPWLFLARTILLIAPPASAALVALGRPGLSVSANLLCTIGILPLLPVLMMHFGLSGAGVHALVQASATAALLAWFVWRSSHDHTAPNDAPVAR